MSRFKRDRGDTWQANRGRFDRRRRWVCTTPSPRISRDELDDSRAKALIGSLDQNAGVGTRHHVVPKFLLENWATQGKVQVYSKVDRKLRTRMVRDLAIRDFYTFIDIHGERNSMLESLLGRVESEAAAVLRALRSGFTKTDPDDEALVQLATFAGLQVVRTPRHRRELELQADWHGKTMMRGRVSEIDLARLTVAPHQNEFVELMGPLGLQLSAFFRARPLMLVTLDEPLLLTGDEPVIVNASADQIHHTDCFLTDEQLKARAARERRKKKRLQRDVSRVVHFWSPVPRGVGTALEIVLPISPASALVWGESRDGDVLEFDRERLTGEDSRLFASRVNDAICAQALDWIIARPEDTTFDGRDFPEIGPLLHVCDGNNAAASAINTTPTPMRPRRLKAI